MAYNEALAKRIRAALSSRKGIVEKKMFGGVAYMLRGKVFCGIVKDDLMVRVIESRYSEALSKPHCRVMDFTGRPLKGFVFVGPEGFKTAKQLRAWLNVGIEFVHNTPVKKTKKTKR